MTHRDISRFISSGLMALVVALIFGALTMYGITSVLLGHALFVLAWLVFCLIVANEVIPGRPTKHKIIVMVVIGILLIVADYGALALRSKAKPTETLVLFGDSPTFTDEVRIRLSGQVIAFYKYLAGIGFAPPTETPMLHVIKDDAGMHSIPGRSAIESRIVLSERALNDPERVLEMYANYAFNIILPIAFEEQNPNDLESETQNRARIQRLLSHYLVQNYQGQVRFNNDKWSSILWEIREKIGPVMLNRSLVLMAASMNDKRTNNSYYKNFDTYIAWYLAGAIAAVDGSGSERFMIFRNVLQSHGVVIP